jgi:hypothetical protein
MRTYECYLLDTQGHIAPAHVIECFDDGEACLRAGKILAEKAPNCESRKMIACRFGRAQNHRGDRDLVGSMSGHR